MKYALYSFDQIVQDVKYETGITNLRNRYAEIIKLIGNAEREINPYTGFLLRKKMIFHVGNGNFDGTKIKKPEDYVDLEKVGCCEEQLNEDQYYETARHIILCDGEERNEIVFTYWGMQCDGNGLPVTTYNHASAVVAYIVWKMFSQKAFMGEGSHNVRRDYERIFYDRCHEARGEDMFPSAESLNRMLALNQMSKKDIFELSNCVDICISCDCLVTFDDDDTTNVEENTPPTISDNTTALVEEYTFLFSDLTKDYADAQNHPPGSFCIYGDINNEFGMLLYNGVPLSQGNYPLQFSVQNISNLTFKLNENMTVINQDAIIYDEITGSVQDTINQYIADGYTFEQDGLDLVFTKETLVGVTNTTNIYAFFDTTSMLYDDAVSAKTALESWFNDYKANNDNYNGNLYIIPTNNEKWLYYGQIPFTGHFISLTQNGPGGNWEDLAVLPPNINDSINYISETDAIVLAFVDETHDEYHGASISQEFGIYAAGADGALIGSQPTSNFISDYEKFINLYQNEYTFFKGLIYPIIKDPLTTSGALVLQSVAALEGSILTQQEIDAIDTPVDLSLLLTENPYQDFQIPNSDPVETMLPLKNNGWSGIFNKTSPASNVFNEAVFENDLNAFLVGNTELVIETIRIEGRKEDVSQLCFPFSVKEDSNDQLESLQHNFCFTTSITPIDTKMWTFQFDNTTNDISNIDLITDQYLENTATEHTPVEMNNGKYITFLNVGRIGIAIQNTFENQFRIFDILENDITETVFDKVYDESRNLEIYISKEYYVPNSIFLKIINIS